VGRDPVEEAAVVADNDENMKLVNFAGPSAYPTSRSSHESGHRMRANPQRGLLQTRSRSAASLHAETTRSRPVCLALYRAASAAARRMAGFVPCAGYAATPIDSVMRPRAWPPSWTVICLASATN
jgi:hypothetical protein